MPNGGALQSGDQIPIARSGQNLSILGSTFNNPTGNAATATGLQTGRTINGVTFDGTSNIVVPAAAATLTGSTLASGVTASSLTSFGAGIVLGTPTSGVATNLTGTASGLTAGQVTTNANLTGPITSSGNATSIASQTGTGSTFAMSASPTFTGAVTGASSTWSGSVAIGTTSSIAALTVKGTNGITVGTSATTVAPAINFFGNDTNVNGRISAQGAATVSVNGSSDYLYKVDGSLFPAFRKCLANVKSGAGRCRVATVGDSTTFGYGAQAAGSDAKTLAWPSLLAKYIASGFGVPATYNGFYGNSTTETNNVFDPRITAFTGAWADDPSVQTAGGDFFNNSGATGNFFYKPTSPVDTFVVWNTRFSGLGTLGLAIDGGSVTNVSQNGATALTNNTVTATLPAIHTLNMTYVSGGAVLVAGIEPYDSKHPGIDITNMGWYGSDTSDWVFSTGNPWDPAATLATFCPDLLLIDLDLNSSTRGESVATFTTNTQTLITGQKTTCGKDIAIVTSSHGTGVYADADVQPYINALYTLAASNNVPIIDNWLRMVSYNFQNTNGWMFDGVHLTGPGYADFAAGVADFLVAHTLSSNGTGTTSPIVSKEKSGDVNFMELWTSATGNFPSLNLFGSDANVGLSIMPQGTGGVGIGTATPTTKLDVNGDITMESGTASAMLCLTSAHALGHCTAAASCLSTCTCTCTAN